MYPPFSINQVFAHINWALRHVLRVAATNLNTVGTLPKLCQEVSEDDGLTPLAVN